MAALVLFAASSGFARSLDATASTPASSSSVVGPLAPIVPNLTELSSEIAAELTDAKAYACDVSDAASVETAFAAVRKDLGEVDVLVFNAGSGVWGNIEQVSAEDFETSWRINTLGAFLTSKQVIPHMKSEGRGNIVIVGATASMRGEPFTTAFAPAKAAQRSLAQAMARHLGPSGVHVSLLIIDGMIDKPSGDEVKTLDPDDIAKAAAYLTQQNPSAWTFELDLRPHTENW